MPIVNDTVLFKFNESNSELTWKLGKVTDVNSRRLIITYSIKTDRNSIPKMKFVERSPRDVVILFSEGELYQNSREYFSELLNSNSN